MKPHKKITEAEFLEAKREFIRMKRRNFILEPYTTCPSCKKETYGIRMDFSDGQDYVRGCTDCGHTNKLTLPSVTKKAIYLDQNIISEMTKILDVGNPNYERIKAAPHYDFWTTAWKTLSRLVKKQLIICPDSFFHRHESVVAKNHKKLFKVYESLSHGVTFQPDDIIQRLQSNHYFKKYLGLASGEISFDPQSIVIGDKINTWHNNFRIAIGPIKMPDEVENLREGRENAYEYLEKIYPSWQTTTQSFEQLTQNEAEAFIKAQVGSIDQYLETKRKILAGEIEPDIYNITSPFALDWLSDTRKILETVTNKPEEQKKIIDSFFRSAEILNIPSILISSLLYASVATAAKNGSGMPTRGVFNDVQCISAYLPYCDAMFVDNENARYLSSPEVISKIGRFGTKIFSLSSKEKFLEYLDEIERSASPEHLQAVQDFYRTDFSLSEISEDFFDEEDGD